MDSRRPNVRQSIRERIELAAVLDLREELRYLVSAGVFSGDPQGSKEGLDELRQLFAGQTPAVAVCCGDGSFEGEDTRGLACTRTITLVVLCASSSYRGAGAGRHGDDDRLGAVPGGDPGAYLLVDDVLQLFVGFDFGLDGVGHARPKIEREIVTEADMTIWRLELDLDVDFAATDRREKGVLDIASISGRVSQSDDEALLATRGAGVCSIAVAAGVATLTDSSSPFLISYVGAEIEITDARDSKNLGRFVVTAVPSSSTIRWSNAYAVGEAFPGTWRVRMPPALTLSE